jgi:hypothetical protein
MGPIEGSELPRMKMMLTMMGWPKTVFLGYHMRVIGALVRVVSLVFWGMTLMAFESVFVHW